MDVLLKINICSRELTQVHELDQVTPWSDIEVVDQGTKRRHLFRWVPRLYYETRC